MVDGLGVVTPLAQCIEQVEADLIARAQRVAAMVGCGSLALAVFPLSPNIHPSRVMLAHTCRVVASHRGTCCPPLAGPMLVVAAGR